MPLQFTSDIAFFFFSERTFQTKFIFNLLLCVCVHFFLGEYCGNKLVIKSVDWLTLPSMSSARCVPGVPCAKLVQTLHMLFLEVGIP